MKKRILFVGEASFLSTGFSTYYRELIPRLAATNKYEICEIGSYARSDDPRVSSFINNRWKFYGTMPTTQEEAIEFNKTSTHPRDNGSNINQFGAGIFDKVCAEFKPDIVIAIRDNWMDNFILRSPFRPWFKLLWMACCDALPQSEDWIHDYENCDLMMAYSDFGIHTLKTQSKKIKLFPTPMRPGVDLDIFKPMDKAAIRQEFVLNPEIPIIGAVYRNQSRKLVLDLIDSFALMKNKYRGEKQADKSALLLHTIWPDNMYSFNYPRHIMRLQAYDWMPNHFKGIKDSVLQTLMCHSCGKKSVTFAMNLYNRPINNGVIYLSCMWCGQNTATGPTTGTGVEREDLAKIYNLMDLYVQCTNCEGDGMPINEAKACGVPTIVTDYSAMSEKGRYPSEYKHIDRTKPYTIHEGGDIINVKQLRHEPETGCLRAIPDIEHLADQMFKYISNKNLLSSTAAAARKCAEDNYNWNNLYKQWEYVLDNVLAKERAKTWESQITVVSKPKSTIIPDGLDNSSFISWLYFNILGYNAVDPVGAKMWLTHLDSGVSRDIIYQQFAQIANQQETAEQARAKLLIGEKTINQNIQEWL